MTTAAHRGYLAKYLTRSATRTHIADYPAGRVVIAVPVGAIVTDHGHAFAVEPVDVRVLPVRVRCQHCAWQATTTGLAAATEEASRHATAHLGDRS